VTEPGGQPRAICLADQPHEILDFEVKTGGEIAGALRINRPSSAIVQRTEADFPEPILTFRMDRSGPAEAVAPCGSEADAGPGPPSGVCPEADRLANARAGDVRY